MTIPPSPRLGRLLNTAGGSHPCPICRQPTVMEVYETAARWKSCGHTRALPPLRPAPLRPYRAKRGER